MTLDEAREIVNWMRTANDSDSVKYSLTDMLRALAIVIHDIYEGMFD